MTSFKRYRLDPEHVDRLWELHCNKGKPRPKLIHHDMIDEFFSMVAIVGECWEFGKGKSYGTFHGFSAHRFSYTIYYGKIPDKMLVLHSCDNQRCVNPHHLSIGDHSQNRIEAHRRGGR